MGFFEFYISRLHPSYQALFQTPNQHFKTAESRWFRNEPLGKNTIPKLMENISLKAELSDRNTNHCIRASTITALYQRGVDAKQICTITKHRDERSLSPLHFSTYQWTKTAMLQAFTRSVLWTSGHTRLTLINNLRRRKDRQDWRGHFSFGNIAESFSLFSRAMSKLCSAHSDQNYERLS